jgi:hypothetical protein
VGRSVWSRLLDAVGAVRIGAIRRLVDVGSVATLAELAAGLCLVR